MSPIALEDHDDSGALSAIEAGILCLLHEQSRALRALQRQPSSGEAMLRVEWAATDLAALALVRVEVVLRMAGLSDPQVT